MFSISRNSIELSAYKFVYFFIVEKVYNDTYNIVSSVLLYFVQRAPVCAVLSGLFLFAYCLNPYKTMHFTQFCQLSLNATLRQLPNRIKCIVLYVLNQ